MHMFKHFVRVILVFLLLVLFCTAYAIEYPCEGIANASSVRVRKKVSTSGAQITTLQKGEAVTVIAQEVTTKGVIWYKIETAKGKQGFVMADYLSIPETDLIEAAKNSPDAQLMQLKITAHCGNYNHVGKNWTQYYEWNGVQVKDGIGEVYTAPNVELSVYARIREQDTDPDTTTEKTLYTPTFDENANGFSIQQQIVVTEHGGKYKGNQAHWTVTYTFTPIPETPEN